MEGVIEMPNWCSNRVKLMGDQERIDKVERILQDCLDDEIYSLSDIAKHLGVNIGDDIYCRGSLSCFERELYGTLILDVETAWSPIDEYWDVITENLGLKYASQSEECGMGVYVIHNDLDGKHFPENYVLDVWEKYQDLTEDYYYFETENDLCTFMNDVIADREFGSFDEIREFVEEVDIGSLHQYERD